MKRALARIAAAVLVACAAAGLRAGEEDTPLAPADHEEAAAHYDAALRLARSISKRDVLIEALLARASWIARTQQPSSPGNQPLPPLAQAFSDLDEAGGYATESGYRIYEADIRLALAWAHRAAGDPTAKSGSERTPNWDHLAVHEFKP